MPIYTDDPCNEVVPFGTPLYSSLGVNPKITKTIDAATRDWLDEHPEATTTVQDGSITTPKLADDAVTTPKIANGSITNDKLADDALPTMGTLTRGVAKVGAGLAMNGDSLELDGSGDIAAAVTSWLNAHPEATTTVQDGSITTDKLADRSVILSKLSPEVIAANVYHFDSTGDGNGVGGPELWFRIDRVTSPESVTLECDVTKNASDTWSNLVCRVREYASMGYTYRSKRLETFDNSHAVGETKHLSVTLDQTEINLSNLDAVTIKFDRGTTPLHYDVDITNIVIIVNGTEVRPTEIKAYCESSSEQPSTGGQPVDLNDVPWLSMEEAEVSHLATRQWVIDEISAASTETLATKQWVSDNFMAFPSTEMDMGRYLMPTYYQVFDDSSIPKYRAFDIYEDFLAQKSVSKDILFDSGLDHVTIFPPRSQSDDVATSYMDLAFESDKYDVGSEIISVTSTKASVPNTINKILCIGDSTLAGYGAENEGWNRILAKMIVQEDVDFNRSSGLIMLGTMGLGDYSFDYKGQTRTVQTRHEGRSGWSLRDYSFYKNFSDDGNPFYDDSLVGTNKFSILKWISRYRTMDDSGSRLPGGSASIGTEITADTIGKYNVCKPDLIIINLGHNDFYRYDANTFWTYYQDLIAQIRLELPDVCIIACVTMPLLYCAHPELYPDHDVFDATPPGYFTNYLTNVQNWKEFLSTNTDQRLFVMPEYNITPTVWSYKWEDVDGCGRTQYLTKNEFGGAHPYKPAHFVWGYELYALYKYIQTQLSGE